MKSKLINGILGLVLAIIAIVPFAIPYAYFPISKFYAEASSLIAGCALFALALATQPKLYFPPVAIAAGAFAVFCLIQPLFVHIYFVGNNYYLALLFFICSLIAIAVSTVLANDSAKLDRLLQILCWALVASAAIQSLIAYLQYSGLANNWPEYILVSVDNPGDGSNIFGNIGQPNQFTDLVSIGMLALAYLFFSGQIRLIGFISYVLLFASAITFTARRGVLLYYAIVLLTSLWVWWRNLSQLELAAKYKKISLIIGAIILGLIVVQFVFPLLVSLFSHNNNGFVATGLNRLSQNAVGQSTYRRFYEWYKAIVLFVQHPLFGVGWYQYPREGIYIMLTPRFMYIPQNMKLYTHCHNSLFNIMAESGVIGTFITIIYGLGYSISLLLRRINTPQSLFVVLMMIPILTHSFLEYPLWYAYFLVLLIILLAVAPAKYSLSNNWLIKSLGGVILLALMLVAINSWQMNQRLTALSQAPTDYDDLVSNITQLEEIVSSDSIWSMSAMMVLDNYIMPGSRELASVMSPADQLTYIDKLAAVLPYPGALFKQIIVHKMVGDDKGANHYATILVHAYPYYQQQFLQQLAASPQFNDVVATMQAFHYQDKSEFSKIFSKGK